MAEYKGSISIDQIIRALERDGSPGSSADNASRWAVPGDPAFHRWFEKGVELLEDEVYDQSMDAFTRAIAINPENPYTYANRARCHWSMGALDRAAGDLMETLLRDPGDLETLVSLGEVLTQDERHEEGIQVLRAALSQLKKADPDMKRFIGERVHYHLGLAQLAVNDLENALGNACQALLKGPESPVVYDLIGRIRLGLGDYDGALNDLEKAVALEKSDADLYVLRSRIHLAAGNDRQADADLRRAIDLTVGDVDAAVALGFKLMDLEEAGWALKSFTNAISAAPDNAEPWYYRASLTSGKDAQAAYADIEKALALDPEMADAHMIRGYLLDRLGQPDAALSAYKRGVTLAPRDAENQNMLGEAFLERRLFHEALTCFELALKLDDQCHSAYIGRATLFLDLGDPDAAVADVQTVLKSNPDNARALHIRAAAMLSIGKLEAAASDFERALRAGESDERVQSLIGLALVLIEQGNTAEATARLDEVEKIDPDEGELHYARAALEEKLGNYDGAARHIEMALQTDDSDARYHEMHGEILVGKGKVAAAKAAFGKALDLTLSRKEKKRVRERIAEL